MTSGSEERQSPPAAIAGYPTREVTHQVGSLSIRLLTVQRLEDYVDLDALLREPDPPEPPYWAHLWPASRVLTQLLATEIDCAGRRVLDIGCGLGLVGVAAALHGALVTMFDAVDDAVRFARENLAHNGCAATADVLRADLQRPPFRGAFDYALAADVTYDPDLQRALARFLGLHLARSGGAWCVESVRTADQEFQHACAHYGLATTERIVHEADEGHTIPVRIIEVRRR